MTVKTTGNGGITQYPSMVAALRANDPFQTGGPHKHSMALRFVASDIDFAIRAGEIDG
jgi:hypothetical protein